MRLPEGYDNMPDCVWTCACGGRNALDTAKVRADHNLAKKFSELYHRRFSPDADIPHEIKAAGSCSCRGCGLQIWVSAHVEEHVENRNTRPDGSVDTHWGEGGHTDYDYFVKVDENSSRPDCKDVG